VSAINVSKKPANILFYGTTYGRVFKMENANQGNHYPIDITPSQMKTVSANVGCIAIDDDNANDLFAVYTNYGILSVFHSTNLGETWEPVSGNLEEMTNGSGAGPACLWLEIIEVKGKKLYLLGTSAGLFVTSYINGHGTVWQMESEDLIGNMVVEMIDTRSTDGYVVVGTHGNGIYSTYIDKLPTLPEKPKLLGSPNNSGGVLSSSSISWQPAHGAFLYDVQLSRKNDFSEIYYESKGIKDTAIIVKNLEQGAVDFYWRVRSISAGGPSDWSEVWKFTTAVAAPELIFPSDKSINIDYKDIPFKWLEMYKSKSYRFQLSNSLSFSTLLIDTVVQKNEFYVSGLEKTKKYMWRVASIDDYGQGLMSNISIFTTASYSSINENKSNMKFAPIPCRDFGELTLSVSKPEMISIELIDNYGRKLHCFEDKIFFVGEQKIKFNLSNYNSGVYYLLVKKQSGKNQLIKILIEN